MSDDSSNGNGSRFNVCRDQYEDTRADSLRCIAAAVERAAAAVAHAGLAARRSDLLQTHGLIVQSLRVLATVSAAVSELRGNADLRRTDAIRKGTKPRKPGRPRGTTKAAASLSRHADD